MYDPMHMIKQLLIDLCRLAYVTLAVLATGHYPVF